MVKFTKEDGSDKYGYVPGGLKGVCPKCRRGVETESTDLCMYHDPAYDIYYIICPCGGIVSVASPIDLNSPYWSHIRSVIDLMADDDLIDPIG